MDSTVIEKIEEQIGLTFENKELILNAFVHRSYLNENRSFTLPSNERLEFLGDACLELVVSEYLFLTYPSEPEGMLTNYRSSLVNTQSLAVSAKQNNLGNYLLLSKGEEDGGGRESEYLLANTFESVIGAIYLDQGYDAAKEFIHQNVLNKLQEIIENELYKDPKSKLQENSQAEYGVTPDYKVISEDGPDHDKTFTVAVYLNNNVISKGEGSSKQKAELNAAQCALIALEKSKQE
ncbi:ribonuclease III [bacterium]|uniref:Ribonuclease 3 n=2 Tax=Katanobacteria TaxID=422282 RepID=A0A2M7X0A5_UNCKA|nr:ribonuclease III [bacterium]PIP56299.1 MAG: ribonuclease III [candidate division WWE3 bacterium CG22_combo_CG10-13_8_21_14_all_39_12]PJA39506.1 MAG: ribonuclease III [candidate division WWE3 bacterium CG_4_9_14_3_um_filter_39_7]